MQPTTDTTFLIASNIGAHHYNYLKPCLKEFISLSNETFSVFLLLKSSFHLRYSRQIWWILRYTFLSQKFFLREKTRTTEKFWLCYISDPQTTAGLLEKKGRKIFDFFSENIEKPEKRKSKNMQPDPQKYFFSTFFSTIKNTIFLFLIYGIIRYFQLCGLRFTLHNGSTIQISQNQKFLRRKEKSS